MSIADPKKKASTIKSKRDHDYLYDNTFIVAGEKDHNKFISKAANDTAEVAILPIYEQMFSELKEYPSIQKVFIPNANLPDHIDLSYSNRINAATRQVKSSLEGRERYKFFSVAQKPTTAVPNQLNTSRDQQTSATPILPSGLFVNKSVQTIYRESSSQTDPYQPEYKIKEGCIGIPEVVLLGDLPINPEKLNKGINKSIIQWVNRLRMKRAWYECNPSNSVLAKIEFYEENERKKEIRSMLLDDITDFNNYPEPLSTIYTEKPNRVWSFGLTKLDIEKNRIRKIRERGIRKLEMKKLAEETADEFNIHSPHCLSTRIPFIDINPDYLPTLQRIDSKSVSLQRDKALCKILFSKNSYEKKNSEIKKGLEGIIQK